MDTTTIHLIRSVKGGSGKTAFALRTVVDLADGIRCSKLGTSAKPITATSEAIDTANSENTVGCKAGQQNKYNSRILYLDVDVHASEAANMLYKRNRSPDINDKMKNFFGNNNIESDVYTFNFKTSEKQGAEKLKHSLNSYIHPYNGYYSKLEEITIPGQLYKYKASSNPIAGDTGLSRETTSMQENCSLIGSVDFIFSDPSEEGRSVFTSLFQSAGQSAVGVGAYLAKIKNLLDYIMDKDYKHVVIDMPPGYDTFSAHLAEELSDFASRKKKNKKECLFYEYYVVNSDVYHMKSAARAAIEDLHVMRRCSPDRISFVYNQGRDSDAPNRLYDSLTKMLSRLIELLKDSMPASCGNTRIKLVEQNIKYELSRLDYLYFLRDKLYYECSRDMTSFTIFDAAKLIEKLS